MALRVTLIQGGGAGIDQVPAVKEILTAAAVEIDWDEHLAKLCDFWSSVTLMTGRFKGSPMAAHAGNGHIRDEHFPMWLALFEKTARDVCPPKAADLFVERSRMIGRSLSLGLAVSRGEIPPLSASF